MIIKWWKKHTTRRQARELIKGTRKALRMQRDILDPRDAEATGAAADALDDALDSKDTEAIPSLVDKLEHQLGKCFPRQKHAAWRENVEVFLVAAIGAA